MVVALTLQMFFSADFQISNYVSSAALQFFCEVSEPCMLHACRNTNVWSGYTCEFLAQNIPALPAGGHRFVLS